jgi:hypothetical protein
MLHFRMASVPVLVAALVAAVAHAGQEQSIPIGGATLRITVPDGWSATIDNQNPPTVMLKAADSTKANLLITELDGPTTDAGLRARTLEYCKTYVGGSVERKATLMEIKGKSVHGFMGAFTDASKDPVEFRVVTAGALASGKHHLLATLLTASKDSAERTAGLNAIRSIVVEDAAGAGDAGNPAGGPGAKDSKSAPGAKGANRDELRVPSADFNWLLVVPGKWQAGGIEHSPDGKSTQFTAMSPNGLMMTIFFEPEATPNANAEAVRAFYLERMKRNPLGMQDLKQELLGEVAALQYEQGLEEFMQHHLNAYLSHKGIWVDVHVSTLGPATGADRTAIGAIAKGIRIEERTQKAVGGTAGGKQGTTQSKTKTQPKGESPTPPQTPQSPKSGAPVGSGGAK